ncbi:MAG: efflux RND transporter periplasmic adaptor subunit [Desulfobulbaceae bacterium]|nr:efflux RND transporter periplasmic adaptor subunit [Desulfobulbaceae bacterium]
MSDQNMNEESNIQKLLALESTSGKTRNFKRLLLYGGAISFIILIILKWSTSDNTSPTGYKTVEAQRDALTVTVSATGNLQPTNQVDVGSEVSGTVKSVLVDYNDFIKVGQVLARLDTTKLQAQAKQSRAAVESARAKLLQARVSLSETDKEFKRLLQVRQLSRGKIPSEHDFDSAQAALERAKANEAIALANIEEAEARLLVDQTNLDKSIIVSPINGVVLKRSVEPGQTVAASLQAPVLFTLAEDLTEMELQVGVDEADVGQVAEDQQATFTVDAHPNRTYPALTSQVRYGAQTTQTVVTYLTILSVDNSDLSLRPGMTATADIIVKQIDKAILVPNAALRFLPPQQETELSSTSSNGSLLSKLFPRRRRTKTKTSNGDGNKKQHQVWTLRDGLPIAVPVTTGSTNGIMTEIISGELTPGMSLIIEAIEKE